MLFRAPANVGQLGAQPAGPRVLELLFPDIHAAEVPLAHVAPADQQTTKDNDRAYENPAGNGQ
jgi:hypothetical protein